MEIGTLYTKIHREVLQNKIDKAVSILDEWTAKMIPLFEDGKTSPWDLYIGVLEFDLNFLFCSFVVMQNPCDFGQCNTIYNVNGDIGYNI